MIEELESYAKGIGASEDVFTWLQTTGKKHLALQKTTVSELEHIIDYFVSPVAPRRLQKMSIVDAKRKSEEWSKANQKKGKNLTDDIEDVETIHDFLDGTRIVKLKTKKALQREGFLMNHCVGGYSIGENCLIYSYRDKNNQPHATFEVQKQNNEIVQIKGKGNGSIHPKYIHPILAFLKSIGMGIRPNDMQNLGYYHIHPVHVSFLQKYEEAWEQVVMINGEAYAK